MKKLGRLLVLVGIILPGALIGFTGCDKKLPPPPPPPVEISPPEPEPLKHRVAFPGETIAYIAAWYTGSVDNWKAVRDANPKLNPKTLAIGDEVIVPENLVVNHEPLPRKFLKTKLRLKTPKKGTARKSDSPVQKKGSSQAKESAKKESAPKEPAAAKEAPLKTPVKVQQVAPVAKNPKSSVNSGSKNGVTAVPTVSPAPVPTVVIKPTPTPTPTPSAVPPTPEPTPLAVPPSSVGSDLGIQPTVVPTAAPERAVQEKAPQGKTEPDATEPNVVKQPAATVAPLAPPVGTPDSKQAAPQNSDAGKQEAGKKVDASQEELERQKLLEELLAE